MKVQWRKVPLGDVLGISTERIEPAEHPETLFNYVGLEHIEAHTGNVHAHALTAGAEIKSTKNVFHSGQILYGKLRPYLNKVHLSDHQGICSTDIYVLQSKSDKLVPSFGAYFLRSPSVLDRVGDLMQGANLPRLSPATLLDIHLPLPSLPEQERIVRIFDAAEELRRLRTQADRRTADLIPALFNDMFGDPATNPKRWKTSSAESLFPTDRAGARCGPFGSALKKHEYVVAGIPVWGIENVQPNRFVEEGSLFITEEKYAQLTNYTVQAGDILISRAGTVGRMCVARPRQSPSIIGTNLIRLALDSKTIQPEYFTALFTYFGEQMGRLRANADEGAYSFMNTTILKSLIISLPPLPLQREFAARATEIRTLEARQAESRRRLDDLFQSLLHRAFQGEL